RYRLAVHEKDAAWRRGAGQPAVLLAPIGVRREARHLLDPGGYLHHPAAHLDLLRPLEQAAAAGLLGLVADQEHRRGGIGQMTLEMREDAAAGRHSGGGDD